MRFKIPKNTDKIFWTNHSIDKMRYYQLSEARLKRVLNNPKRKELGIAPGTVAVMQPTGSKKHPTEIWLMYQVLKKSKIQTPKSKQIRIITAWRYPAKSPIRGPIPIPPEILEELGENN
jgi:hypothetical protein